MAAASSATGVERGSVESVLVLQRVPGIVTDRKTCPDHGLRQHPDSDDGSISTLTGKTSQSAHRRSRAGGSKKNKPKTVEFAEDLDPLVNVVGRQSHQQDDVLAQLLTLGQQTARQIAGMQVSMDQMGGAMADVEKVVADLSSKHAAMQKRIEYLEDRLATLETVEDRVLELEAANAMHQSKTECDPNLLLQSSTDSSDESECDPSGGADNIQERREAWQSSRAAMKSRQADSNTDCKGCDDDDAAKVIIYRCNMSLREVQTAVEANFHCQTCDSPDGWWEGRGWSCDSCIMNLESELEDEDDEASIAWWV